MTPQQEQISKEIQRIDKRVRALKLSFILHFLFLVAVLVVTVSMFVYSWNHPELTTMQVFKRFITFDF